MNKDEYIVISKTVLEKRMGELIHNNLMGVNTSLVVQLKQVLTQSTPLTPIVEDAFMNGSNFKEKYVKEIPLEGSNIVLKEPDFDKYILNLKINV